MEKIVGFAIEAWRVTLGIMLFIIVGGLVAVNNLPLDAEPDIPVPFVNVRVVLPGVSPGDAPWHLRLLCPKHLVHILLFLPFPSRMSFVGQP
mgnify:CR=1 FL=1